MDKAEIEKALAAIRKSLADGSAAVSQQRQAAIRQRLKDADANGDGKLSKDEAPEPLKAHFGQIDANGDAQRRRGRNPQGDRDRTPTRQHRGKPFLRRQARPRTDDSRDTKTHIRPRMWVFALRGYSLGYAYRNMSW